MASFYIWSDCSGFGPAQSHLIDIINDDEYLVDSHIFDNWSNEDIREVAIDNAKMAQNCAKKCTTFSISAQNISTGEVVAKKVYKYLKPSVV